MTNPKGYQSEIISDLDLDEHRVRPVTQSTAANPQILEAIYALAVKGEEFTSFDVLLLARMEVSPQPGKGSGKGSAPLEVVAKALKRAELAGIVEMLRKERRHRPMSPQEFLAGKGAQKDLVSVYRGQERIRDARRQRIRPNNHDRDHDRDHNPKANPEEEQT